MQNDCFFLFCGYGKCEGKVITRYDMDKGYRETGWTLSGLQTQEQLSLVWIYWKKEVFQREDNGNGNLLSPDVVKSYKIPQYLSLLEWKL